MEDTASASGALQKLYAISEIKFYFSSMKIVWPFLAPLTICHVKICAVSSLGEYDAIIWIQLAYMSGHDIKDFGWNLLFI